MQNKLILPRDKDDFSAALQYAEAKIKKVFFVVDSERIDAFLDVEFINDPYDPKITDDSKFEIRYVLKSFPIQKYGSFCCDFDDLLFLIIVHGNDGSLESIEIQTGSFTVVLSNDYFEVKSNDYWSYKTYDAYIRDVAKRRGLGIIG
jgi:hypothetical protein